MTPETPGRYEVPGADPQPASVRPGLVAPAPVTIEPDWWARLRQTMDLDTILATARRVRRTYRNPGEAPEWCEVEPRLEVAKAMLLDALDRDPANRTAAVYLSQVERELRR